MQVDDYVERVRSELDKRRNSYVDKLLAVTASEHDRLAGTIKGLDEAKKVINDQARRFLIEEEAA